MHYKTCYVILTVIILTFFNSQSYAYDKEKFGVYEDLRLQGIFSTKIGTTDPYRTAATEIQFRFLNKKSTLDKYPAKAIEGIIWFEIFYNESIKNEQSVIEDDVIDLWEIRKGIRESFGFDKNISIQEAIDRYYLLSRVLSQGKTEKINTLSKFSKERKKFIQKYKSKFNVIKQIYVREADIDYKFDDQNSQKNNQEVSNLDNKVNSTNNLDNNDEKNTTRNKKEREPIEQNQDVDEQSIDEGDESGGNNLKSSASNVANNEKLSKLELLFEEELITEEEYLNLKQEIFFGDISERLKNLDLLYQDELLSEDEYYEKRRDVHNNILANTNSIQDKLKKIVELVNNELMNSNEFIDFKSKIINDHLVNMSDEDKLYEMQNLLLQSLINQSDYNQIKTLIIENLYQSTKSTKERLLEIKKYLKDKLIDEIEYNQIRGKILDDL